MFQKINLSTRLFGSFVLIGGIVFVVGLVGWNGASRLSEHIDSIGRTNMPSVDGLWQISEGETQIDSSERSLVNPKLTPAERQTELSRINNAQKQIDEGLKEYDPLPRIEEEDKRYKQMLVDLGKWKQNHQKFMQINQELLGTLNPSSSQLAASIFNQLNEQTKVNRVSYEAARTSILSVIDSNREQAIDAIKLADRDINNTKFWVLVGAIGGPLAAIILGIFLSIKITKPLSAKIANIVNSLVSSSSEIAATVEQQERAASQQAASVSQTTTTMDELGASSRISAEQAESAAAGARRVLALVDGSNYPDSSTEFAGSSLREKVGQIAEQILRLSEQTQQIGSISALVSDLANQTNMLALNAAVEAVRAGDHGKGFGVVASEIRKLANQSKKSAERINALVVNIQNATNSTVMATDDGRKTVENVVEAINNIAVNTQQISLTAKQQSIAIQQVVDAMNALKQGASQTASGISQTKVGTQRLNDAAQNLKAVI